MAAEPGRRVRVPREDLRVSRQEQDVVEGQRRRAELGLVSHGTFREGSPATASLVTGGGKGPRPTRSWRLGPGFMNGNGSPAEFGEAGVVDPEVMADLMHDSALHLVNYLVLGPADGADRQAVDGDPVRQHPGVARRAAGQRDPLIEPEQARRAGLVLDHDRHVAHQAPQPLRQAVEGRLHHLLEPGRAHLDHELMPGT